MEFTHIANPVRVRGIRIEEVTDLTDRTDGKGQSHPDVMLRLADGENYRADSSMTSRYIPVAGDYLVCQEDGYTYLNPKDVFERKYRVIGAEMPSTAKAEYRSHANEDQLRAMALEYASRHYAAGSVEVVLAASAYYDFLKGAA